MTQIRFAYASLLVFAVTLIVPICKNGLPAAKPPQPSLLVFLVRHAEKLNEGADPDLSEAGKARARQLACVLRDARIEHVHSSDTRRTRNSAAPTADRLGLEIELYDPRDLPALVDKLKSAGGRHLVVGHSNTTPQLVEFLGGQGGSPIEESEFDRLYVIQIDAQERCGTILLRYGQPFQKTDSRGND